MITGRAFLGGAAASAGAVLAACTPVAKDVAGRFSGAVEGQSYDLAHRREVVVSMGYPHPGMGPELQRAGDDVMKARAARGPNAAQEPSARELARRGRFRRALRRLVGRA